MNEADFRRWRDRRVERINGLLTGALDARAQEQPQDVRGLLSAMRHGLLSGGKRLRPLLALAAADAAGGREAAAWPGALAVEMIHAYSLIHDDLPALDDDDLRRGQPTCHLVHGEAMAVLAGDALQSLAFETLAAAAGREPAKARRVATALRLLAQAAGPLGMAGGQAQDLAFESRRPTAEECLEMEKRKTGELLAASLGVGAALAGAGPASLEAFRRVGLAAGTAFQIVDDLLNQSGDPAVLGKAVGTDAQRGKASALSLLGPEKAALKARQLADQALELAARFKSPKLDRLLRSMVDRRN
ncbi:MAG: polyprenyl synthetase family protein [Deltaproteobacteria bacterium]|jgi:geranylgeranyl pyrophosphate synthase|nr:polyprenyl synthetase family protein [Deltaproteobacteria bacterium]